MPSNAAKCDCSAYKFPHRPQGGACRKQWIERYFREEPATQCFECRWYHPSLDDPEASCEVLSVDYMEAGDCPAYADFLEAQRKENSK